MAVRPNHSRKEWKYVASNYVPALEDTTHAYFARTNQAFKDACSGAGVQPTKEQARRYSQKKGAAYRWKETQSQQS